MAQYDIDPISGGRYDKGGFFSDWRREDRPYPHHGDYTPDYFGAYGHFYGEPRYGTWRAPYLGHETTWGYAGRGPKGYKRPDARIEEDVNDRLTQNNYVDASDIKVSVKNGEVTLEGTVDDRRAKRIAEDVSELAAGVKDVHNRLRIEQATEAVKHP